MKTANHSSTSAIATTPRSQAESIAPHMQIWDDLWGGMWRAQALAAAIDLDLFTHIERGNHSVAKIAAACGASEEGIRRLLDAMTGMGYLQKSKGETYRLRKKAEDFLVREKPFYMGDLAAIGKFMMMSWTTLPDAVRQGKSVMPPRSTDDAAQFFSHLVPAIFTLSYIGAKAVVAEIAPAARRRIKRILDVAAGAAAWSIPFASAIKDASVTVIDYPGVIPVTKRFTARWNVAAKYEYREGDLQEVEFGNDQFDLVILGHIIHGEGAEQGKELIRRSYRALREQGMLLIGEFVPNDERSGPEMPLLFSLNMLLNTPAGDVFTMREYREWLREAGFKKVNRINAPAVSPIILATKS
jgi:3-hydroxy-5-methyl-1-naphthoate 3-O-methyltransferase